MHSRLFRWGAALVDVWRGASGSYAYDQFVEHCRRHHPDRAIPTRAEFARHELVERWNGVRRCC